MGIYVESMLGLAVLTAAFGATVSCANVLGIEETRFEEETKPNEEPAKGHDWRCVGNVPYPTSSQPIQIRAMVTDFSGMRLQGLTVKACAFAANFKCNTPVASAESGDDGIATLDIPANAVPFTGYLRLGNSEGGDEENPPDPSNLDERVPYVSYYSRPIAESLDDPIPFLSVTWAELNGAIPNASHINGRGHLFINATDCQNVDAPGIHYEIKNSEVVDNQSVPFYVTNSGFSSSAEQTVGGPLVGGRGGVFNLVASYPPSKVDFDAISRDTNGVTASAEWWIFPNTLTTGRLLPQ